MSKRVYLYKYVYIYIYIYIYSVFIYLYASLSRVKRERGRCFLFLSLLFGLLLVTHTHARIIRSSIPPAFFFLRLLLTFFALRAARVWKSECCVSQGYMERERRRERDEEKKNIKPSFKTFEIIIRWWLCTVDGRLLLLWWLWPGSLFSFSLFESQRRLFSSAGLRGLFFFYQINLYIKHKKKKELAKKERESKKKSTEAITAINIKTNEKILKKKERGNESTGERKLWAGLQISCCVNSIAQQWIGNTVVHSWQHLKPFYNNKQKKNTRKRDWLRIIIIFKRANDIRKISFVITRKEKQTLMPFFVFK